MRWAVAMLLLACGGSAATPDSATPTDAAKAACAAAGGQCTSEDTSGCSGKAYPYCLPPPGGTYCEEFGGTVLDVDCGHLYSCCAKRDAGAADAR